jgi:Zn-dependent metalloprotease
MAVAMIVIAAGTTAAFNPSAGAAPRPVDDPGLAAVSAAAADALVATNFAALKKSPSDTMVRTGVTVGTGGLTYVAYERTYRGLPVVGGDLVVTTGATGAVLDVAVAQSEVIAVDTATKVDADAAVTTARSLLATVETVSGPRLAVLAWGTPRMVWEVKLTGVDPTGAPTAPSVYVDALSGAVADVVDLVRDGTGSGFHNGAVTITTSGSGSSFSMLDTTRPGVRCGGQTGTTFTGTDDVWGNSVGTNLETACVDALYAAQRQWDMLSSWLGRNGVNGSGRGFPARVGLTQVNAFWNGSYASFGRSSDGQRQATSMDVVGHEFGHAIFQTTPGGAGGGRENGGLNEGTGDIFGALTEHFANNPNDPPDYQVGEEVNLSGNGPIRFMYNPSLRSGHPNCWSTAIPNTAVHAGAGPLNHWFYLLAAGSNPASGPVSPTCNGARVTGIGIQNAGRIFYNALLAKTSTWRYANVRLASLRAAANLFGANSVQCGTVKAAWNAVSVPVQAGEPTCAATT